MLCAICYAVGRIVRNICSDADKIEAIGLIGVQRCLQYSAEVLRHKGLAEQVTAEVLISQLVEHGHEKLFILLDEYVVTEGGRRLGRPSHDAMMTEVEGLIGYLQQVQGAEKGQEGQQREALKRFEGGRILLAVLAE